MSTDQDSEHDGTRTALRVLADAQQLLDAAFDYMQVVRRVPRLAVPAIADGCAVYLLDSEGRTIETTEVCVAPGRRRGIGTFVRRCRPDLWSPASSLAGLVGAGQAVLVADVSDDWVRAAFRHDGAPCLASAARLSSLIAVPLVARRGTLGAMVLFSTEPRRRYDAEDLEVAQELARLAGLAIDNARRYRQQVHIARTLQESLLPRELPRIQGYRVESLYVPGGDGATVGGDLYDVFEVYPGAWGVLIADVSGKGAEAAAVMALVKYTLRAIALHNPWPSGALGYLNEVLLKTQQNHLVSAVFGVLEEDTGVAVFADAGHPPPVVRRRGGHVEPVGVGGRILGAGHAILRHRAVTLRPGDLLLLYTDGLTEARLVQGEFFDLARVRGILEQPDAGCAAGAIRLLRDAVAACGRGLRDDLAILAIEREPDDTAVP